MYVQLGLVGTPLTNIAPVFMPYLSSYVLPLQEVQLEKSDSLTEVLWTRVIHGESKDLLLSLEKTSVLPLFDADLRLKAEYSACTDGLGAVIWARVYV